MQSAKPNQKGQNKKNAKTRHFPYPDWMQNVTVTCKTSQFLARLDKQCNGKLTEINGCVKFIAKGYLTLRYIVGARLPRPLFCLDHRKAHNTQNTLKEEVFSAPSAFSVDSAIQTKIRAGKHRTYATVSNTLHTQRYIMPNTLHTMINKKLASFRVYGII